MVFIDDWRLVSVKLLSLSCIIGCVLLIYVYVFMLIDDIIVCCRKLVIVLKEYELVFVWIEFDTIFGVEGLVSVGRCDVMYVGIV